MRILGVVVFVGFIVAQIGWPAWQWWRKGHDGQS